jgi:hypothetical protein
MGNRIAAACCALLGLLLALLGLALLFNQDFIERFFARGAVTAAILYGVVMDASIVYLGAQIVRCLALAPAVWRGEIAPVRPRARSIRNHTGVGVLLVGFVGVVLPFIVHFPGREWMILMYWAFVVLPPLVVGAAALGLTAALASRRAR